MVPMSDPLQALHPPPERSTLEVAVIGAGYWGPNLARNFKASPAWDLRAIVDMDVERALKIAGPLGDVPVFASLEELWAGADVDAVAIATPARTHYAVAMEAMAAGKHVVVEKPLAASWNQGVDMVEFAKAAGVTLMADHTYCYTPAALKIRELIAEDALGEILFIDSTRINLGLIQPDVDVFWDLAPHDLSIIDFILPGGLRPETAAAQGADPLGTGKACVGHLTFALPNNAMAHINVNWLSPTKIRQLVIGGSRRTLVWDDLNPQQRLSVYDRGVNFEKETTSAAQRTAQAVSYRLGDTWSPALPEKEALGLMVQEFADSIHGGRPSRTEGAAGLRVLSVLEAASRSLAAGGGQSRVAAHESQLEGTR